MGRSKSRNCGRKGGNGRGSGSFGVEMMVRPREERKEKRGKDLQIDVEEKVKKDDSLMEFGKWVIVQNPNQHTQHRIVNNWIIVV